MKVKDYYRIEEDVFSYISKNLEDNLSFYCVTGSLAKKTVLPGWSDVDVLLGIHEYNDSTLKHIKKIVDRYRGKVKVGVTLFSTEELNNYSKYLDPKTHKTLRDIKLGLFKPRYVHQDIDFSDAKEEVLFWFDHVDLTKMLHELKRSLLNFSQKNEHKVYKLITVILKILLLKEGRMPLGYDEILGFSKKYLGLNIFFPSPQEVMKNSIPLSDRYDTYLEFLVWLNNNYNSFNYFDSPKEGGLRHLCAGGFVLHRDNSDAQLSLLVFRDSNNDLLLPKGHLEKDETHLEAAKREIIEETGINMDKVELLTSHRSEYYSWQQDEKLNHKVVNWFLFQSASKELKQELIEQEDVQWSGWLDFDEAGQKIKHNKEDLPDVFQKYYFLKNHRIYSSINDIEKLSVIITSNNNGGSPYDTVGSLVGELSSISSLDWEIIIIDNQSGTTHSEIKKAQQLNPARIHSYKNVNHKQGKASSMNLGYSYAKGDILLYSNDDVTFSKGAVVALLKSLISNPRMKIHYSKWRALPYCGASPIKKFWSYVFGKKYNIEPYRHGHAILRGASMLLRKEDFPRIPEDEDLNEDQYMQYVYFPKVKESAESMIHIKTSHSPRDLKKRANDLNNRSEVSKAHFSKERVRYCDAYSDRKVNHKNLLGYGVLNYMVFMFYKLVRNWANRENG